MFFYTFLIIVLYIPLKILFPVRVIGKGNVPKKKPYILVCNHLSWKDVFIVSVNLLGYRKIVAKKEVGNNIFVRIVVKGIGAILVDRANVDLSSIRTCIASLKAGKPLLVFPEGTRNRTGNDNIQEIKQGAAMMAVKGGVPVVAAIIDHKQRAFRRNHIFVASPVSFEEFSKGRLDSQKLTQATEFMASVMNQAQADLKDYLLQKKKK